MRRNKLIVLCIVLVLLLSGCWGHNEPERMLYVHGFGLDYVDSEYKIYAQIIDFKKVAKSETPNTDPSQSEVGHATGKTIEEAIFKLYNSTDQNVYWGHMTYLVISEAALKNGGLQSAVDTFIRYRETRYHIWMYGTKDPVEDILLSIPIINTAITLSRLGDPINSYKQASLGPPVDIRNVLIGLDEPGHEMALPFVSITKRWSTTQGQDNVIETTGAGLVSPKEFKGFLSDEQISGLKWMKKETERGEVTFSIGPERNNDVTVTIKNLKVKVKPIVEGDSVKFDVDVTMQGELGGLPINVKKDEIKKRAIQEIKRQIEATYKEGLKKDVDIYRLSESLYRKDVKAWKRLQQDGKVELTEDSIRTLNVTMTDLKSGRKTFTRTVE